MPFCPNCGTVFQPGAKFCMNCGNPLQQQSQAPPPPPPAVTQRPVQSGEQVYAAMSGLKKGLLGRDNYVMLITQERLMFVKLSGDDVKNIGAAITQKAKDEGAGMLGRLAAGITASSNLGQYFINWTPQQVSAQYNDVVSVNAQSVRELRIRSIDVEYSNEYELRIKSVGFNEKFKLSNYDKKEHQALKQLLGGRFKSNTWFL